MACGTPVACFDSAGPADIVDHQVTGYKAQPFDCSDLARGVDWMLARDDLESKKLRESSRKRAIRLYDSRIIAKKYVDLYNELFS
jgi:glycosyltransferase involved in cell wall biosynthesis